MNPQTAGDSGPESGEHPRFAHWRRNVRALSLGVFASTLGFTIAWPFLPLIVRDLGVTSNLEAWVGFLVGGFFATSFLLTPVWGSLADHYGKRGMILRAGFGMGAGFLLLPFMPGVGWFLPMFLLIGLANGYTPAALALVASNTPPARLGWGLSTVQMAALVGNTLGPALGAGLVQWLPRPVHLFWCSAALLLAGGAIALTRVREAPARPAGPLRLRILADLAICLRVPALPPLFSVNFMVSMTFFGSTTVVSLYTLYLMGGAPSRQGLAVEQWVGLATVALTVSSAAAVPFWGRLLDRFDSGSVLAVSLFLAFAASLWFPFVGGPLELTLARLVLGALAVGTHPATLRLMKEHAPTGMDARVLAFGTSLSMLGNGGAPVLAGLLGPWLGLRAYFGVNAALLLFALGWWWAAVLRPARHEAA
jgi:DHA1 family multidrug resistance protein-like MFS transporter